MSAVEIPVQFARNKKARVAKERRKVIETFKADVGLQQTLGRMEEYLAKLS